MTDADHTPNEGAHGPAAPEPTLRSIIGVPDTYGPPHYGEPSTADWAAQVHDDGEITAGEVAYQDRNGDWRTGAGDVVTCARTRARHLPNAVIVWPNPDTPTAPTR